MSLLNDTVKALFQKTSETLGLRELQAEEAKRLKAERLEEREVAHRALMQARAELDTELPELNVQVERDRDRVAAARVELAAAEKALAESSGGRLSRSLELNSTIARLEVALRSTAAPEITELLQNLRNEFEKLRLVGETHILSGRDPGSGEPATWIRTNQPAITAKLERIEAARKRALELQLELTDPAAEIEKLKASIDTGGGIAIEEIKGRLATPAVEAYDRYEQRKQPLASDPPRREHW
jgi:hypothetical protein